ncbi:hypothetical protein [Kitasatospora sp. NPDC056800]|uniref:hypothetical protein n=1 Tax=Kitasatospora sp. NPDC056800 TaxID=3345948 RepID=UPI0036815164
MKEASGCSLSDIMRLGENYSTTRPGRAVAFKKPTLSGWFKDVVPSDPRAFGVLVEILEPLAGARVPGRARKSPAEWEQLRRRAERERRQGMGIPRTGAEGARADGVRADRAGKAGSGPAAAGQPRSSDGLGAPATAAGAGAGAVAAGDASKAVRVLAALPPYEPWLRTLRTKPMDRVHTTVDEAFTRACERLRAEVAGFIDPDLHEAYTAVEETALALESELEGMFGPDSGSPWRVLTDCLPQRSSQLDGLHAARDRFEAAYRALLDALNRRELLPQADQAASDPSATAGAGPRKHGSDGIVALTDAALLALRRALEDPVPLEGFDSDLEIDPGAPGEEIEWERMCDPALGRRSAYRESLRDVRDAFDGLAPYELLVAGPSPTREDLELAYDQVQRLRARHL